MSLLKIELIYGLIYLSTGIVLHKLDFDGIITLTLLVLMILFLVFLLKNIKKHVFWHETPILSIYSIFYKIWSYTAAIWIFANYPEKGIITLIGTVLCIGYCFFADFNKKQYKELLNALLYWQMLGVVYSTII